MENKRYTLICYKQGPRIDGEDKESFLVEKGFTFEELAQRIAHFKLQEERWLDDILYTDFVYFEESPNQKELETATLKRVEEIMTPVLIQREQEKLAAQKAWELECRERDMQQFLQLKAKLGL